MTEVIAITGAAGFLGRATVRAARNRGHRVRAIVRHENGTPGEWAEDDMIETVTCDLSRPDSADLNAAFAGVSSVIHTAGRSSGSDTDHEVGTILPLRQVLAGIEAESEKPRLVHVSSFSVYDAMHVDAGGIIDGSSEIEAHANLRDAYCRAKLEQERMIHGAAELQRWIVRPGILFGPGRIWNDHLGVVAGPIVLRLGGRGELPLCQVEHCADALVLAAETPPQNACEIVNLVDDDRPNRATFLNALQATGWRKVVIPVHWRLFDFAARVLAPMRGLPGLLRRPVLHARMKPLRYDNTRTRTRLGWRPDTPFATAFAHAAEAGDV